MKKVLALDLGTKRIGIALSDSLRFLASGKESYITKSPKEDMQYILKTIQENDVDTVVIGLPINMNGTEGEKAALSRQFAEDLKNMSPLLNIVLFDERLTTSAANRYLLEADLSRKKRKQVIDKLAATIILQNYLDSKSNKTL